MSNEVIKVLDALSEKVGMTVDWTSQNIMPYLQQLCKKCVRYETATSIVWVVLGALCVWICWLGIKKCQQLYKNDDSFTGDVKFWSAVGGIVLAVAMLIAVLAIISNVFDIVTCVTFPEKIILNEFQQIYSSIK